VLGGGGRAATVGLAGGRRWHPARQLWRSSRPEEGRVGQLGQDFVGFVALTAGLEGGGSDVAVGTLLVLCTPKNQLSFPVPSVHCTIVI